MEFVNPPEDKRQKRSAEWQRIVTELKANPQQWAKVGNFSPGVATAIRRGKYKAFLEDCDHPDHGVYMAAHWEVRSTKTNDGSRNDVFIRWLG